MAPRRKLWLVAAVVGALVFVSTVAPVRSTDASAQAPPLRVAIFGDSVLLGAKEELLTAFTGLDVSVDAAEDRSLLGAIGLFRSAGPALGDVVVLDLGYNDSSDPAVFRGRVDDAMSALAGVKRVIWLNQHDWGPGRAGMNAELAAAASRYPNLDVVDWNAEVAAHPEYVYADAIHLTPAGQPAMAAVVRAHFDRFVESLTPTTTTSPPTTAPATTRAAAAPAQPTSAGSSGERDGDGIDVRTVVIVATVVTVALLVLALVTTLVVRRRAARRRRAQRRASSSAPSASGSVTGSRQAKRSHT